MTRAKRDGNDRDFRAAIRVKRKLFKLRAFTADLQAPISFSLLRTSPSLVHPLFFFFPPSFSPPHRFSSLPPTLSLFKHSSPPYRSCFFSGLPYCIQSGSTKLETAALSALLRLLLSAVPVSPCLLPLVAFFIFRLHLCPFCPYSVGGPLLLHRVAKACLDVARTGRRYSWHWVQIYWTCCSWSSRTFLPATIEFTIGKDLS